MRLRRSEREDRHISRRWKNWMPACCMVLYLNRLHFNTTHKPHNSMQAEFLVFLPPSPMLVNLLKEPFAATESALVNLSGNRRFSALMKPNIKGLKCKFATYDADRPYKRTGGKPNHLGCAQNFAANGNWAKTYGPRTAKSMRFFVPWMLHKYGWNAHRKQKFACDGKRFAWIMEQLSVAVRPQWLVEVIFSGCVCLWAAFYGLLIKTEIFLIHFIYQHWKSISKHLSLSLSVALSRACCLYDIDNWNSIWDSRASSFIEYIFIRLCCMNKHNQSVDGAKKWQPDCTSAKWTKPHETANADPSSTTQAHTARQDNLKFNKLRCAKQETMHHMRLNVAHRSFMPRQQSIPNSRLLQLCKKPATHSRNRTGHNGIRKIASISPLRFVWVARMIRRANHKNIIMATKHIPCFGLLHDVAYALSHIHTCRLFAVAFTPTPKPGNIARSRSVMYAPAINLILIASKYFVLLFISSRHQMCECV